jgi:crotonobetainyl-CoA:carnitine CoA-transferase CaiB-like acyl-CoA transferase
MSPDPGLPLSDLTVIDLSLARSGPTAVRQLADWGANVIRIDPPSGTDLMDPSDADYLNLHRNKRGMTLNLKEPTGRELFEKLVRRSDVVVENFRPRVKDSLGISYDALSAWNPGVILGSISGFGQDGPYAEKGGLDQIAQGLGGLMSVTGRAGEGPMRAGIAVSDSSAGHMLAFGIMAALHERARSGRGQWVQVSLLEAMIAMLDFQAARWTVDHELATQAGNEHPNRVPMGVFPTADGHINIAAASHGLWQRFCGVLEQEQLVSDERFVSGLDRTRNREALAAELNAVTSRWASGDLLAALDAAGVPAGPINTIAETFEDPQVQHLGMTFGVAHPVRGDVDLIRQPLRMSRSRARTDQPSPMPGQHTTELLAELGISADEAHELHERGVL